MLFYERGELYRKLAKIQATSRLTRKTLEEMVEMGIEAFARINDIHAEWVNRDRAVMEEYCRLKHLYDKIREAKRKTVDCECCGFERLVNVAISEDGQHYVGPECLLHYDGTNPCDRYRKEEVIS